ncbi:phosphotransferase enzyme family protein [Desulfogranum japonicum]|uniref:phosphotransferase enzyme family protein n=1 Tax=Desulfogranum japonicum TaxID=231447 RepID=UPI0004153223|nr:aminoglycoside phosphotransferase family protein [Desulfogranum japonicum]
MEYKKPQDVLCFFLGPTNEYTLSHLGQGKVNDTWLVRLKSGEQYVLQKIPAAVFSNPSEVMHNQRLVTTHLKTRRNKILQFYRLISNTSGHDTCYDAEGNGWRLLSYLEQTRTLEKLETEQQAESLGAALAHFHSLLSTLDSTALFDPLPDFHNTPVYLKKYRQVAASSCVKNKEEQQCMQRIEQLQPVVNQFEKQKAKLTSHIIHGDPKVSNFLFCQEGKKVISLIDLDTVKPGLLLHDLGDCCRSCCNQAGEEHHDPEKTTFSPQIFAALLRGYASHSKILLHPEDLSLLPIAAKLISFELGIRFFTDHLQGNTYFKVTAPGQNLHRALIQFYLATSIDRQLDNLQQLVHEIFPT